MPWLEDSDWWENWLLGKPPGSQHWRCLVKALRSWAKWLGSWERKNGGVRRKKCLTCRLKCLELDWGTRCFLAPLISPFFLLNRNTRGFTDSVGNIQRTHRASTNWVPLKMYKKEGNQHSSVHVTDSKLSAPVFHSWVFSHSIHPPSGQYNRYLYLFMCDALDQSQRAKKMTELKFEPISVWLQIFYLWDNKSGIFLRPWILG